MKVIALCRFGPQQIDWTVLDQLNPAGGPPRLFVVGAPPYGLPYAPPSDPDPLASSQLYDVAAIWDDIAQAPDFAPLLTAGVLVHAWSVQPTVGYSRGPYGDDREALTLLGRLMFHADLPDSAAQRSWALHAALAERVHIGACHYVQNWVLEALVPDCPPTRGLPELRFPNEAAAVDRFFDSDRGRMEILQDTAHFVASGPRLYLRQRGGDRVAARS